MIAAVPLLLRVPWTRRLAFGYSENDLRYQQLLRFTVPLSLLSLITGAALSLGTKWGLLRHYWVLAKLLMNVVAIPMLTATAIIIGITMS